MNDAATMRLTSWRSTELRRTPESSPFEEYEHDMVRPSPGGVSALNAAHSKTKTRRQREQIEAGRKRHLQAAQSVDRQWR